ncbi:hypothetical protein AXF42_Ash004952 [Apostasia shenzhenica]|uniref:Protein NO VEIN C-terminal domain-containing protein n=1 Tax=Apostasia shenzhenica TaxID=1088818 RepID=A0A2I0B819_9ASPA|nr:hypothetical protein AXF42_Ash004952 [Apostasia shenzhenica]
MYGSPGVYRPRGSAGRGRGSGGGGRKPSQQPPAYYAPRNPNYVHPATAPSPSSSFSPAPYHQQQNPSFQTPYSFFAYPVVTREMVEAAVAKVERDLLSGGENVSVWKVTQSAALALQISSWESIGFKFNDIPYLRSLQFVEGKVNSFIHCFVSVRRMTTVHDLGLEICKSEGVEQFEELGLGPLLRHPLVRHYFMIPSELKEVCSITIDDLMSALSTFLYKVKFKEITVEEFLTFLVEKYSLPARENLGVRIQSMGVSVEDIAKQIDRYFKLDCLAGRKDLPLEKQLVLQDCRIWLKNQFLVDEFESLGHGPFYDFLDKYISILPGEIKYFLAGNFCNKPSLEVSMSQRQISVVVSQAARNCSENTNINEKCISMLLRKQFPAITLHIAESVPDQSFLDLLNIYDVSCSVAFSMSLLGNSTDDAIACLLRAPMLSDMRLWSHWDLVYGPALGPLNEWLIDLGSVEELLCIVTTDGKIIRVDHSASLDGFLEALIHRSAFHVALKLLSLFHVYGGSQNIPISLLRCYAQQGIDAIIKSSMDDFYNNSCEIISEPKSSLDEENVPRCSNDCKTFESSLSTFTEIKERRIINKDVSLLFKAYSSVSLFILDCLQYHPSEFWTFTADILVSAFQFFNRDAPMLILNRCKGVNERIMLHEIGLALGIVEWIEDYRKYAQLCYDSNKTGSRKMQEVDAAFFIEKIRKEEFGLDSDLSNEENILLKKQHARLGRALHCLSQELYSQDSHFILELVQNADDNSYHGTVEPTLVFILHASGVVVMNNEHGFSTENIRALCDVGNSTKKGSSGGYIGQKGIGFKSVFRITNAPEIHSNGFHVKFDITEGQIGFVLPTVIPRYDINFFKKQLLHDSNNDDSTSWNTCIVLPFKSKLKQGKDMSSVISMFSDLHPSLLLFLQRLKCIMFKNMLDGNFVIMRRETLRDGVVMVSHGPEMLGWLVVRKDLQASFIRPDVQTTKIALAFTIEQSEKGDYNPVLDQQPVFAFLPLRKYGLKFIIQADFVLPSSREEVDEDSAWNQWLLSELPDLFVSSEKSFCALACFKDNPAKGITSFMSFVPLTGEVHGFFSSLPHMILSKLRLSNCLLSEGSLMEWVPPCKVLRSWSEPLRIFLTDNLLQHHLGLHYLNKDISLPDSLARALGVQEYGPKILIGLLSSVCQGNGIEELGLDWLSSWLHAFYTALPVSPPGCLTSENTHIGSDLVNSLRKISFIPLSDGSFCSLEKGPIWLPYDISDKDSEGQSVLKNLPGLYAELRTVSCSLFSVKTVLVNSFEEDRIDILIKALQKIGLQKLSAHDIVRNHILPSISVEKTTNRGKELMVEYLLFIMIHLQTSCIKCNTEREDILSQVRKKAILLTNNGYICPIKEPIHFSKELGNTLNIKDIVNDINIKWNEVDSIYLKHPSTQTLSFGLTEWREFFKELGVTDFVQVNPVKKNVGEVLVDDWDSPELISILSAVSSNKCLEKSRYLVKVLDEMWDDVFSAKAKCCSPSPYERQRKLCQSSFMKCTGHFKWVACSIDEELHYPEDLFYDSESVHSLLGTIAPYAVPQVTSRTFVEDIGFKVSVTLDDALRILQIWRCSPYHSASISQMSKFYTFIRDELVKMTGRVIPDVSKDIVIFVPLANTLNHMDIVSGVFMQPDQLYWHDPTGGAARISKAGHMCDLLTERLPCINLDSIYPELYGFFVADCGVLETPSVGCYFHILLHLSRLALPSEVAHEVFNIFLKWSGDVMSGLVQDKDILELKQNLLKSENAILPTAQNKWVSLHSSFGLICWCEDQKLIDEYIDIDNVNIIYFGKLTVHEKEMHSGKVAVFLKSMGIPILEEVVCREAIFYGVADATNATSLINWVVPYAQRYLYKLHSNTYCNFKESEHKLTQLEVFVVEKLFYRNTLQGNYSMSKKRYECKSLLQGNSLYTTPHADTHSIFLEFSRIFFNGTPDLLMANFLHIVSNEFSNLGEQIESFIVNNLNVPELPEGEPIWSEEQSYRTGRLGEMVAYKYFCEKLGKASVKWVNEKSEMRLPYDLIVNEEQNSCFVEVKATTSASKDWFLISTNEWNYACRKRGRYSIVWVTLSSSSDAEVIVLNDPLKLCQQNLLQLALLMPKTAVIGD